MDTKEVKSLIKKADGAKSPLEAMQFTQAALNAANALRVLVDGEKAEKQT